jgi:energy-coupling factor transport system ATP-binding protein
VSIKPPVIASAVDAAHAVSVAGLSFTYHGSDRRALEGASFVQARGETIGIIGASGAGKSTLVKCLNRIIPEFEGGNFHGIVWVGGRRLDGLRVSEVAGAVGMVFQDFEAQLFSTNVAHEVAFAMEQAGISREEMNTRIGPALEAVGLAGFEHRDPTTLSGGEKQRLAIAAVLALGPDVIVMDEPTTDLDPEGKAEIFALIRQLRERGLSLLVIEHETGELRTCDRLMLVRDGEIIADAPPADLLTRLELLEECGAHPPQLNRVLAALGIAQHAADVDHAEALLRSLIPHLPHGSGSHVTRAAPGQAVEAVVPENNAAPLVEIEHLSFSYPGGPRVLDSVGLSIRPGEFVAIIGQNGSGKTTLAKQMVGLLRPGTGRVLIEGRDRTTLRPAETAQQLGYVFQNPDHQIFAATVEDEVAFGPRNFGLPPEAVAERCAEVLNAVNLERERERDPFVLGKGERQRLAVASVLALRPRLLILDEPTTGLDYGEQRRMMKLVSDLNGAGIAIVIITHTPWLVAAYARRAVLMRRGRVLFDGPVREFFADEELLRSSSFRPPEVTALGRRFGVIALTAEELVDWLRQNR